MKFARKKMSVVIFLAACTQSPESAKQELEKMDIKYDEMSFIWVAAKGDNAAVKLFIKAGMNINAQVDVFNIIPILGAGITPLLAAICNGQEATVKILLDNGANPELMNRAGITPLRLAREKKYSKIEELLIKKGAKEKISTNFTMSSEKVITDSKTGLEWFEGPDENTTLDDAYVWVSSLTVAGGGWRLPTIKELKTLYIKGEGNCNLPKVFQTTGWEVWTGEKVKDKPEYFTFDFMFPTESPHRWNQSRCIRAFAVRSRKSESEKLEGK
jgi:hypothetical protein